MARFSDLIKRLGDEDPDRAAEAARELGELGDKRALPALVEAAKWERAASGAAYAILKIAGQEAAPLLIECLRDGDETAKFYAADALGYSDDERAIEPLIAALDTEGDADVLRAIIDALGSFSVDDVLRPMLNALSDDDPNVRLEVARTATDMGEGAWPLLLAAAHDDDWKTRGVARDALGELSFAETPLTRLLLDDQPGVLVRVVLEEQEHIVRWTPNRVQVLGPRAGDYEQRLRDAAEHRVSVPVGMGSDPLAYDDPWSIVGFFSSNAIGQPGRVDVLAALGIDPPPHDEVSPYPDEA